MKDFKAIKVTKGVKMLEIDNPTDFPLIGMGSQGAVFKLSDEKCVKIYTDELQAKMEADALKAGEAFIFFPKVYDTGSNFVVMEYFDAPNLKEYLRNCTYIPESITVKLLQILKEMKKAKFTMIDAPLRHIFVLDNEELKVVDHVNAFKRQHPVPLKLLRDLKIILLKDSFLSRVKKLEPELFKTWEAYFAENKLDYKNIPVSSGGSGKAVKVESAVSQPLIGKGHQGAVYRIAEDQCVKIYGKPEHCKQEKDVLLSGQKLSFIPKVHETGSNYVVMEYLLGPDLNSYLKKQSVLSIDITKRLLDILTTMKKEGYKQMDAPLRHIFVTKDGFKLVDHVYSFTREQNRPLELFLNLHERNFLDAFLKQVKELDPKSYAEWTKTPIPLTKEEPDQTKEDPKEKEKKKKNKKKNNGTSDHKKKKRKIKKKTSKDQKRKNKNHKQQKNNDNKKNKKNKGKEKSLKQEQNQKKKSYKKKSKRKGKARKK